jgi:dihydroxyacetone kinase
VVEQIDWHLKEGLVGALEDEIKAERVDKGGRRSMLDVWMEAMAEADRADLFDALTDRKVSQAAISAVLRRRGMECTPNMVQKWRNNRGVV